MALYFLYKEKKQHQWTIEAVEKYFEIPKSTKMVLV